MSFRFEMNENLVTKHHMGKAIDWEKSAKWAALNDCKNKDVTICSVKQIDADTVEIVKRRD